jgi:predicted permease
MRRRVERDTDDEIATHFAERVEALVARGLSRADAEAEARRRFGPYDTGREQMIAAARHRERVLTMFDRLEALRYDLTYAARSLRLRPGFTTAVAITLAFGIGINAAMFGILDRLLFRAPALIVDPDRVVQLHTARLGQDGVQSSQPYALYSAFASGVSDFAGVAVSTASTSSNDRTYYPLGRGVSASRVAGAQVTPSFFTTLGVHPVLGRFFTEAEAGEASPRKLAVIGYGFWQRQFGGASDAIGQTLDIGADRYTVVGVAPKAFTGAELSDIDVWIPIAAADGLRFQKGPDWAKVKSSQWLNIYARLKPGVNEAHAAAQATAAYRAFERQRMAEQPPSSYQDHPDSEYVVLGSIIPGRSPSAFGPSARSGVVQVSRLLGVVSVLVLLLACANVANLLLVRTVNRRREIAVRLALGISRRRLGWQLMLEGLLLSLLGAAGALVVVYFGSGTVRRLLLGGGAWTGSAIDGRMLLVTGAAALLTTILTSLLPVVQATSPELANELRSGVRDGGMSRSLTRAALLGAQTALAIVLLAGAGLFIRSLRRALEQPVGVDINNIVIASVDYRTVGLTNDEAKRLYLQFADQARAMPGVTSSAVAIGYTFGLGWGVSVYQRGATLTLPNQGFSQYAVTPDYFTVMGIHRVAGRGFTDLDREGTTLVAIVNETAARTFWPKGDAVGQCIQVQADTMPCTTIVGVVTNARRQALVEGPVPQIYRPLLQLPSSYTDRTVSFFGYTLLARAADPDRALAPLRRALQAVSSSIPYVRAQTMDQRLGSQTRSWQLGATMFGIFGALALALAAFGMYSVVAFTLASRKQEYGVRLALGASGAHVVRITLARGLFPAIVGLLIGTSGALAGGKVVSSLLFQTAAYDPVVLGTASAVLLLATTLACLVPGLRAARTDPAIVMRGVS